mmetsp:Transcript_5794/g.12871  ORF Transcript_5794/g.12871 Transcript_5794/m.12871 type:complete len:257 (-) Transcript_5794:671-1441(-)
MILISPTTSSSSVVVVFPSSNSVVASATFVVLVASTTVLSSESVIILIVVRITSANTRIRHATRSSRVVSRTRRTHHWLGCIHSLVRHSPGHHLHLWIHMRMEPSGSSSRLWMHHATAVVAWVTLRRNCSIAVLLLLLLKLTCFCRAFTRGNRRSIFLPRSLWRRWHCPRMLSVGRKLLTHKRMWHHSRPTLRHKLRTPRHHVWSSHHWRHSALLELWSRLSLRRRYWNRSSERGSKRFGCRIESECFGIGVEFEF